MFLLGQIAAKGSALVASVSCVSLLAAWRLKWQLERGDRRGFRFPLAERVPAAGGNIQPDCPAQSEAEGGCYARQRDLLLLGDSQDLQLDSLGPAERLGVATRRRVLYLLSSLASCTQHAGWVGDTCPPVPSH